MQLNDFHYAQSLLKLLYDIDMDTEDFEEVGLIAWKLIGNKRVRLYRYVVDVNQCNQEVELPCNVDEIEAVTLANMEEWAYSTHDTPNGDIDSAFVESYIEHRKAFRHPMYAPGKYIKYERVGDKLYFDRPHGKIFILYKGEIVDDDGLPQLTDKEARAIATFCAYVSKLKEAIARPSSKYSFLVADQLRADWLTQCDLARLDYYVSLNEWDQILDARSSWMRKMHGMSLKIYQ